MAEPSLAQGQIAAVTIHGVPYFSVDHISREKGLELQWDPFLKNATVQGSEGFIKFHVDSEFILNQDRLVKLNHKVLYFQGEIMAPLTASEYVEVLTPAAPSIPSIQRIKRVVIDAGHGGYDLGAVSPGGIKEKELALTIAKMVARDLRKAGLEVLMTRGEDVFIPLPDRSRIANDNETDFFISIHANASPSRALRGFEVYYLSEASDDMAVALEQAENVPSLRTAQVAEPSKDLKAIYLDLKAAQDRKESIYAAKILTETVRSSVVVGAERVRSAQFHVLKWTQAPSVLIEIGYLTNTEDELNLADPIYEKLLAKAIVRGFMDYKIAFERTNGFMQ